MPPRRTIKCGGGRCCGHGRAAPATATWENTAAHSCCGISCGPYVCSLFYHVDTTAAAVSVVGHTSVLSRRHHSCCGIRCGPYVVSFRHHSRATTIANTSFFAEATAISVAEMQLRNTKRRSESYITRAPNSETLACTKALMHVSIYTTGLRASCVSTCIIA